MLYAALVTLALTLLTLVFPMARRLRTCACCRAARVAAALGYFALIGLGFMFVEIGLLSRLNVFLGHPTLALAVLLGGMISSRAWAVCSAAASTSPTCAGRAATR